MASVISFRIDDEDKMILQAYAEEYDATISWAARRAIKEFVAKLAKESKNEIGNYILTPSDGIDGEEGTSSQGNNAESKES